MEKFEPPIIPDQIPTVEPPVAETSADKKVNVQTMIREAKDTAMAAALSEAGRRSDEKQARKAAESGGGEIISVTPVVEGEIVEAVAEPEVSLASPAVAEEVSLNSQQEIEIPAVEPENIPADLPSSVADYSVLDIEPAVTLEAESEPQPAPISQGESIAQMLDEAPVVEAVNPATKEKSKAYELVEKVVTSRVSANPEFKDQIMKSEETQEMIKKMEQSGANNFSIGDNSEESKIIQDQIVKLYQQSKNKPIADTVGSVAAVLETPAAIMELAKDSAKDVTDPAKKEELIGRVVKRLESRKRHQRAEDMGRGELTEEEQKLLLAIIQEERGKLGIGAKLTEAGIEPEKPEPKEKKKVKERKEKKQSRTAKVIEKLAAVRVEDIKNSETRATILSAILNREEIKKLVKDLEAEDDGRGNVGRAGLKPEEVAMLNQIIEEESGKYSAKSESSKHEAPGKTEKTIDELLSGKGKPKGKKSEEPVEPSKAPDSPAVATAPTEKEPAKADDKKNEELYLNVRKEILDILRPLSEEYPDDVKVFTEQVLKVVELPLPIEEKIATLSEMKERFDHWAKEANNEGGGEVDKEKEFQNKFDELRTDILARIDPLVGEHRKSVTDVYARIDEIEKHSQLSWEEKLEHLKQVKGVVDEVTERINAEDFSEQMDVLVGDDEGRQKRMAELGSSMVAIRRELDDAKERLEKYDKQRRSVLGYFKRIGQIISGLEESGGEFARSKREVNDAEDRLAQVQKEIETLMLGKRMTEANRNLRKVSDSIFSDIEKLPSLPEIKKVSVEPEKTESIEPKKAWKTRKERKQEEAEKESQPSEEQEKMFGLTPEDLKEYGFEKLSEGKKRLVMQNFNQLVLGRVEEEAVGVHQKKHQEAMQSKGFLGRVWTGFKENWMKGTEVAREKKLSLEKLTKGGKEIHGETMKTLVEMAEEMPEVVITESDKIDVLYLNPKSFGELTVQQGEMIDSFNNTALNLSHIPYEWSLETASKKEKEQYQKAQEEFDRARDAVLKLRYALTNDEGDAVEYVAEAERHIRMNQFLNTHPEAEEKLKEIKEKKAWRLGLGDSTKAAAEYGGYTAFGMASRMAIYGTVGWVAAPAVAAPMAAYRAGKRVEKEYQEQDMLARRGVQQEQANIENSKAIGKNFVPAEKLTARLDDFISRVEDFSIKKFETDDERLEYITKTVHSLKTRIEYTERKLWQEGLVNFGTREERLANEYKLMKALERAKTLTEIVGGENEELNKRLDQFLGYRQEKIDKARTSNKRKRQIEAATYGAAFSVMGMGIGKGIRTLGEHFGLFEHAQGSMSGGKNTSSAENYKSTMGNDQQSMAKSISSHQVQQPVTAPDNIQSPTSEAAADTASNTAPNPQTSPVNMPGVVPHSEAADTVAAQGAGKVAEKAGEKAASAVEQAKSLILEVKTPQAGGRVANSFEKVLKNFIDDNKDEIYKNHPELSRFNSGQVAHRMVLDWEHEHPGKKLFDLIHQGDSLKINPDSLQIEEVNVGPGAGFLDQTAPLEHSNGSGASEQFQDHIPSGRSKGASQLLDEARQEAARAKAQSIAAAAEEKIRLAEEAAKAKAQLAAEAAKGKVPENLPTQDIKPNEVMEALRRTGENSVESALSNPHKIILPGDHVLNVDAIPETPKGFHWSSNPIDNFRTRENIGIIIKTISLGNKEVWQGIQNMSYNDVMQLKGSFALKKMLQGVMKICAREGGFSPDASVYGDWKLSRIVAMTVDNVERSRMQMYGP